MNWWNSYSERAKAIIKYSSMRFIEKNLRAGPCHPLDEDLRSSSSIGNRKLFFLRRPQLSIEKLNRLLNDQEIEIFKCDRATG